MSECKTCQVYEELKDLWRNCALAAERARDRAEARVDDLTSHANAMERKAEAAEASRDAALEELHQTQQQALASRKERQ